jgi:hypothetical protein
MVMLALVATSCRSTRPTTTPTPETTPTESLYTVITFTGTVEGINVSGQVRMEHGKVIWCSVNKFIELGRAMATPDSVWVRATMMDVNREGSYRDLERLTGRRISFADLEAILLSDDADRRITALGRQLGYNVQVHITRREKAQRLTFPFNK